jgi:hypothetical protein
MNMNQFFERPSNTLQRQYEAIRAFFVDKEPLSSILKRFDFTEGYFKKLRFETQKSLRNGVNPFFPVKKPGPKGRFTQQDIISRVVELRKTNHSINDIQAILHAQNTKVSLSCINNILKDEGFASLPRRTQQERHDTRPPDTLPAPIAHALSFTEDEFVTEKGAGPLIFLPLLDQLGIIKAIENSLYPGTSQISAVSYILSFLALKLIGNQRHGHDVKWNLDRGLGFFAGLNVLPKNASLSSYSYRITREMNKKFLSELAAVFRNCNNCENDFNLDFKTIPHWGDKSVLEKNWAGSKSKAIKSILSLIVQKPDEGILVYSDAEIKHENQNNAVLEFVDFWKESGGKSPSMLIFDSKFTTYENLSKLNADGIKFLTLRRRGSNLKKSADSISEDAWVKIEGNTRKYSTVSVHDSRIGLRHYDGEVRQIIIKDNGREQPAFLITNDFESPLAVLVRKYGRRWLVEQEIAEQVDFFHLNHPSSSIVVKVDFDLTLSLLAHNLYRVLAEKLAGFEHCTVATVFRNFLDTGARVKISKNEVVVSLKKKTHMPILFAVPWMKESTHLSWMNISIAYGVGTIS